jgi:predicted nuclease with TOPRIM domain
MSSEIWVAVIGLIGVIITVIATNKVTLYRIGQLEKKQEKYNHLQERVANRELHDATYDERMKELTNDVKAIKKKVLEEQ